VEPAGDNVARAQYFEAHRRTRRRLEAEGYTVYLEPQLRLQDGETQGFPSYRPDLVAVREPDEMVVVEIRARRWVGAEPDLEQIERYVKVVWPNARFVTVVAAEPRPEESPLVEPPVAAEKLSLFLEQARDASAQGSPELGIVLACAAVEGALRHVAPPDIHTASEMLRWATVEGPIEHPLYGVLQHAFRYRNDYVHGRRPGADFPRDLSTWAEQVISTADQAMRTLVYDDWPRPESE
jgi:hypothetical protein